MARKQKRLTHKELREDPLVTAYTKTQDWFTLHGTKVIIGVVVLAIVVFGSIFYGKMRASAEQEAAASLMEIGASAQNQTTEALKAPLQEVADNYKGTQAAADALFALAQLAAQENNWEAALDNFTQYVNEYGDNYLSGSAAMMGRATALENLNKRDEAAAIYDEVANRKDANFASEFALLDAARCYVATGDTKTARDRYQRVIDMKDASNDAVLRAKLDLAVLDTDQ